VPIVSDGRELDRALRGRGWVRQRFTEDGHTQTREDDGDAQPARVDHAGFAQSRQQLGRASDARPSRLLRRPQHRDEVIACRAGRSLAHHGQHRPFDGRAHGLVGCRCRCAQRTSKRISVDDLDSFEGQRSAAEHLGQDDAAVAARAQQRSAREGSHVLACGNRAGAVSGVEGGPEGEQHVRTGVAIGHRVHVDRVDRVAVPL